MKKNKKMLKETSEGESNLQTTKLQDCITELTGLKSQVETLIVTSFDEENSDLLNLMNSKIDYVTDIINKLINPDNEEVSTEPIGEFMEADNSPKVNMSVDNVVANPDDVKKLEDKKIEINLTDANGKSLVVEHYKKIVRKTLAELKRKGLLKTNVPKATPNFKKRTIVESKGFPDTHAIVPEIIADQVGSPDKKLVDYLTKKANYHYDNNPQFKKLMDSRGNKGRDALYDYMEHWKAAWEKSANVGSKNTVSESYRKIVKQTLSELKKKGLLKESSDSEEVSLKFKNIKELMNHIVELLDKGEDSETVKAYELWSKLSEGSEQYIIDNISEYCTPVQAKRIKKLFGYKVYGADGWEENDDTLY